MLRFNRSHLPLDQKMQDFWDINGFLVIEDFYAHEECDKLIYKSEKLIDDFKWNEIIYNSKFSFEPVIGEIYYLYNDKSNEYFLSLINPQSWNKDCVGEFSLNSEGKWIRSI